MSSLKTSADPVVHQESPGRLPLGTRLVTLAAVVVPFLALLAAAGFLWGWGFNWVDLALLVAMYLLTAVGITVGFHRLFTHRSFETYPWVKVILGVLGSMAVEASLFKWVAHHRVHHQHSDQPGDPHSPHLHGRSILGLLRGVWHAHVGWVFAPDLPSFDRYVPDLRKSPSLRVVSALFPLWVALGLLIPTALGGLLTGSWAGAWTGLLWGGLGRVFLVHHVTWSVNSVCHVWGLRPYESNDQSRDNFIFGVLAFGEGWHNTHHAFPTSARHGLRWWQLDGAWMTIRTLEVLGLAWNVKVPTLEAQRLAERGRATAD